MLDFVWIILSLFFIFIVLTLLIEVFRYGANMERRNQRTDLWGRPNNVNKRNK